MIDIQPLIDALNLAEKKDRNIRQKIRERAVRVFGFKHPSIASYLSDASIEEWERLFVMKQLIIDIKYGTLSSMAIPSEQIKDPPDSPKKTRFIVNEWRQYNVDIPNDVPEYGRVDWWRRQEQKPTAIDDCVEIAEL